jgi:hypothetical protein
MGFGLNAYVCIGEDYNQKKKALVVELRWPGTIGNPMGKYTEEIAEKSYIATEADGALIQNPEFTFTNKMSS